MALYAYRCTNCGDSSRKFPIAAAPDTVPCPGCPASARRLFGIAGMSRGSSSRMRLLDATHRSASEPPVVSAPPTLRRSAPVTSNPLHRKLPRP
ncbi:FmdB family zinc ribbon protein [Mycobacteroides salmoniphilum]|uniref:FmdB family zinc ribbon protein n=1 Tax=Mycobacteroides salmoniphilum TaxID=404941 RepID=UPI001065237A|nr:zinc ribbon domain-containing protein [Mycobacteroides salmoniphilum]